MKETKSTMSGTTSSGSEVREVHHYHDGSDNWDRWDKRITGAFTMIVIGIVLFMNTTGNLSWSVWWEFLKFWPVFIISAGIQLILSFSKASKVIAEFIGFFIFLLLIFFAAVNTNSGIFANSSLAVPKMNNTFPFFNLNNFNVDLNLNGGILRKSDNIWKTDQTDATSMKLAIDHEVGVFELTDLATDNAFFNAMVTSDDEDDSFKLAVKNIEGVLNAKLETEHATRFFWKGSSPRYSYSLSPDLLTDLEIKLGAGSGKIDFTAANKVKDMIVKNGAGEIKMNFANEALPQSLDLDVGAGQMVLEIPENVAFELDYKIGVGNVSVEGYKTNSGLGVNNTLRSENWETAPEKILIKLNVGAGSFVLNFN